MTVRLIRAPGPRETRTAQQLWEQYVVERELADRLRNASHSERGSLYTSTYEELFKRIPHHSQLTRKATPALQAERIEPQLMLLRRWLTPRTTFLEIGAGDCALSLAVANKARHVYALDVSPAITRTAQTPPNFTLVISDGTSIPVPDASITLAYSNQLMEHLHPDDALLQLTNIYRALAPGGIYICITPNRLTGPHDISRYFDTVATGFHLKEYTCRELTQMLRLVGFRSVHQCFRKRKTHVEVPSALAAWIESSIEHLPRKLRTRASATSAVRGLLDIRLVATK